MNRLTISLLLIAIIGVHSAFAQDYKVKLQQIDEFLSERYNSNTPGCVVGIIKGGKLIFNKGFGMANLDYGVPMAPATTLNIMSVSKQFTAACIALLVIDKKLSLDDDVHKYIPELPEYGHKITIEHLIRHTSGIRDVADLVELSGHTPEDLADRSDALNLILRQKELNFVPGDHYAYSNSGYILLTYVIEKVSGMSFTEFAKKRLFEPLGMNHSFFSDDSHQIVKNRAVSYGKDENDKYFVYNLNDNRLGCAGLFTTVEDIAKWDQNFYDGKVGGEKFNQLMLSQKPFNSGKENDYAFGNIIDRHEGFKEILHSGGLLGIRCKISRFPTERLTLIYLGNASQNLNDEFYPIASLLLVNKPLPKPQPQTSRGTASTDKQASNPNIVVGKQLEAYTGTYYSDELRSFLDVIKEGDMLVFKLGHKSYKAQLTADSNQLQFRHPEIGQVTVKFANSGTNAEQSFIISTERTSSLRFAR